jgi:tetratricopeptide (TPR) repeat protein
MNIPHASVTDHRIRRKPGAALGKLPTGNALPFVLFHVDSKHAPSTDERERDLGIALAKHLLKHRQQNRTLFDEAISRLEQAVAHHPSDAFAWSLLSQVRSVRGQWKDALADIEKALRINPNDESMLKQAVQCTYALYQPQKSLEYAQQAAALNPGNIDNHTMIGNAYIELGDYKQAEEVYRKVIRTIPSWANAYAGLAICLHRLGNPQEARLQLELAVELDPEHGTELREWYRQKTK